MKRSTTALWRALVLVLIASMALAACATPTAPPAERIVETVEVVRTVEVEVEVERTVEVQVETVVEVTPTPGPATGAVYNQDVSGDIEIWHFWASPVRRNAVRRVIAMCQQDLPNVTVTDVVKPWGDIWTANIAAVAAGSGMPDVIVSDRPTIPRDAEAGVYMDLQEFADRDNVTRDQFYDWAWDQSTFEGNVYGIPFETDVTVLYYNKNLFEAAGLDPNKPPTTWAEVEEYADALDLQNADGTYQRIGFFPLWNRGADVWQYNNAAEMVNAEGEPQINNENMVATVEWLKSWVDRYGGWQALQDFRNKFSSAPNDLFMGNGVAMHTDIFGYNSFLEFYRPYADTNNDGVLGSGDPRMDWGVALLPYNQDNPEASTGTWSGGFSLSIPTGADNPDASWEFIKCMSGAEAQASWARDTQAQPTNIEAAQDPVLAGNPLWGVVDEALAVSTGGNIVPAYPNWGEQLGQRWEQVWLGTLTPQQMLDEAQQAVLDQIGQ